MKKLLLALLALTLGARVQADTFQYSYTFEDGTITSGTFDGTQNGILVESISNISLFFNGTQASGPFFAAHWDGGGYVSGATASFDVLQNNFFFVNSDYPNGDNSFNSYLYIVDGTASGDRAYGVSHPLSIHTADSLPAQARWSLTNQTAAVPDAASTMTLLGASVAGLLALRRRRV